MITPDGFMPDVTLNNQDGNPVRLRKFHGKNVVLFSFPASMSACARQMALIERLMDRFNASNTVVLGISGLKAGLLRRFKHEHRLSYDLLCDNQGDVLRSWDMWGVKVMGLTLPMAQCGYLVVDESGCIIESGSHLDPETSVEKALRTVKIHTAVRYSEV
jgi:thioredoxin-dependent peroxiredoxin